MKSNNFQFSNSIWFWSGAHWPAVARHLSGRGGGGAGGQEGVRGHQQVSRVTLPPPITFNNNHHHQKHCRYHHPFYLFYLYFLSLIFNTWYCTFETKTNSFPDDSTLKCAKNDLIYVWVVLSTIHLVREGLWNTYRRSFPCFLCVCLCFSAYLHMFLFCFCELACVLEGTPWLGDKDEKQKIFFMLCLCFLHIWMFLC